MISMMMMCVCVHVCVSTGSTSECDRDHGYMDTADGLPRTAGRVDRLCASLQVDRLCASVQVDRLCASLQRDCTVCVHVESILML